MSDSLAVSPTEVLGCLQFLRTHLYAAQAQAVPGDDTIITRHVYDAYRRVSDVCKEVELHGIAHPAAPAPCIGNDPACPCQDGDLCHYKDSPDGKTKAMAAPAPSATVDEVMALAAAAHDSRPERYRLHALAVFRAAVEQIVREGE